MKGLARGTSEGKKKMTLNNNDNRITVTEKLMGYGITPMEALDIYNELSWDGMLTVSADDVDYYIRKKNDSYDGYFTVDADDDETFETEEPEEEVDEYKANKIDVYKTLLGYGFDLPEASDIYKAMSNEGRYLVTPGRIDDYIQDNYDYFGSNGYYDACYDGDF